MQIFNISVLQAMPSYLSQEDGNLMFFTLPQWRFFFLKCFCYPLCRLFLSNFGMDSHRVFTPFDLSYLWMSFYRIVEWYLFEKTHLITICMYVCIYLNTRIDYCNLYWLSGKFRYTRGNSLSTYFLEELYVFSQKWQRVDLIHRDARNVGKCLLILQLNLTYGAIFYQEWMTRLAHKVWVTGGFVCCW